MHINFEISVKDITILLQIIRVVVTALSYPQSHRYISIPCPMMQKKLAKRKRTTARCRFTRIYNDLNENISDEENSAEILKRLFFDLDAATEAY